MNKLQEQIDFLASQALLEIRSKFRWSDFKELKTPTGMAAYLANKGTKLPGKGFYQ